MLSRKGKLFGHAKERGVREGQAGVVPEEMNVTKEEGLEQSWCQDSCRLPGGSGELAGF